ncbi:succinate dehydrogenase assembly factor 2 [Prosthecomicrobium hirschii]|uniref:FAD assembly factor SdhE n=1 Tax=Prosthecodimorpha hirschii TaxID=665126 RepID=UPI0022210046|nr:succinate dehydrogenase assembly factor 2 [Prosthecomicrobium hirschii]MCW1839379.1 succinate dehydrogenase assembly factor 2 [Prosthecomicrobium hirschii]
MSGTQISSDGLAPARKRALFRAWHRGTKEMDLLLGTFADAHLAVLSEADFEDFVQLMEVPDTDLFAWIIDRQDTPGNYDTPVFRQLKAFQTAPGGIVFR